MEDHAAFLLLLSKHVLFLVAVCCFCCCVRATSAARSQTLYIPSAEPLRCEQSEEEHRHLWAIDMGARWLSVTDGSVVKRP